MDSRTEQVDADHGVIEHGRDELDDPVELLAVTWFERIDRRSSPERSGLGRLVRCDDLVHQALEVGIGDLRSVSALTF